MRDRCKKLLARLQINIHTHKHNTLNISPAIGGACKEEKESEREENIQKDEEKEDFANLRVMPYLKLTANK